MSNSDLVAVRVERELSRIRDARLLDVIRTHLVQPYAVERDWEYGVPGQKFVCWTVLEHRKSGTGVAYCDEGFGPTDPWGLVLLDEPHPGIGTDAAWFSSLEDAVRDSCAWDGPNPPGYEVG